MATTEGSSDTRQVTGIEADREVSAATQYPSTSIVKEYLLKHAPMFRELDELKAKVSLAPRMLFILLSAIANKYVRNGKIQMATRSFRSGIATLMIKLRKKKAPTSA